MSVLPKTTHDEAWFRNKLRTMLVQDPEVRVQRLEDGYGVGIADFFIGRKAQGAWVEVKHHEPAPNGVLLPPSKIKGNQIAWLKRMDRHPCKSYVLQFTDTGYVLCPIDFLNEALLTNKSRSILTPGFPKNVRELFDSAELAQKWVYGA